MTKLAETIKNLTELYGKATHGEPFIIEKEMISGLFTAIETLKNLDINKIRGFYCEWNCGHLRKRPGECDCNSSLNVATAIFNRIQGVKE
jgi:hypothetical protein